MALKGPICSELPILKLRLSYEKKEEGEEKVSDSLVTHGISGQKKKKKKNQPSPLHFIRIISKKETNCPQDRVDSLGLAECHWLNVTPWLSCSPVLRRTAIRGAML